MTPAAPTSSDPTVQTATPGAPDPDCLFCRIVAGDVGSRQVYADDHAVAFLDVAPWQPGHTLVVSRRHVPDLVSGSPVLAEVAPAVDAVARLLADRLAPDGFNVLSSAGAVAGQTVFHTHLHVVPRYAAAPGLAGLVDHAPTSDAELDAVWARLRSRA